MVRSGEEAIAWIRQHNDGSWYRACLKAVRMSFDCPGGTLYAGQAWDNAIHKHRTSDPTAIPRGVPVFWETPAVADHVALSLGNGFCLSGDILRRGYYDRVHISTITHNWHCDLLGWTADLNGVRVYHPSR